MVSNWHNRMSIVVRTANVCMVGLLFFTTGCGTDSSVESQPADLTSSESIVAPAEPVANEGTTTPVASPSLTANESETAEKTTDPPAGQDAVKPPAVADRLSITGQSPELPAELKNSERLTVQIAYELNTADECMIYVRPMIAGKRAGNYGAHAAITYGRGKGTASGWFTMQRAGSIDGVEVRMVNADTRDELARIVVPVQATWVVDSATTAALTPKTPTPAPKPAPFPAPVPKPPTVTIPVVGEPAPAIEAVSVFGHPATLDDYRGRIVLLDFWATWCGPCIAELPNVKNVFEEYGASGFTILGISLDSDRDRLVSFIAENDMPWEQVYDGQGWKNSTSVSYGVKSIPRMYVLDDTGTVRFQNLRGPALAEAVAELVAERQSRLLEQLASDDDSVRSLAAFRIGESRFPDAADLLTPLTSDQPDTVRQRAAVGLALASDSANVELLPLIRAAVTDEAFEVRVGAFNALGRAGDAGLLALAEVALEEESRRSVRLAAFQAVVSLGGSEVTPLLGKAASDDDASIAIAAIRGLGQNDAPETQDVLTQLAADPKHVHRVAIAVALHSKDSTATGERFTGFLNDQEVGIRRAAVRELASLKDFKTFELYTTALEDKDSKVRRTATEGLDQSADDRAKPILDEYFTAVIDRLMPRFASTDRRQQSGAYGEFRDAGPAIATRMFERLDDVDRRARFTIASLIGRMKNPDVIAPVSEKLRDTEVDDYSRRVYESILRSSPEESRSEIDSLAASEEPDVRTSGMRLLSSIKDDDARTALLAALNDAELTVRCEAATGLARLWQDMAAFPVLKEIAESNDQQVQGQAIVAIGVYPADAALDVLLPLSSSSDVRTKSMVLSALGQITDKRATEAIVSIFDETPQLARNSVYALSRQNTDAAVAALAALLKHENAAVRTMSRQYLSRMRNPAVRKALSETPKTP